MSGFDYGAEDLVYRTPLSEPELSKDAPKHIQTMLGQKGVNYNNMEIGKISEDKWVLLKPGKTNFGRAAPAHLAYDIVDNHLDLNTPGISYDTEEDTIIVEHLGDIKTPKSSENISKDSLIKGIAIKSLMGDPGISGNIGVKNRDCYIYDFDQAGNTVGSVEKSLTNYIDTLNRNISLEISLRDVERELVSMVEEIDLEDLEEDLNSVKDFYPDVDEAVKFRPEYITYNIGVVREGDFFSYEETAPSLEANKAGLESGQIFF